MIDGTYIAIIDRIVDSEYAVLEILKDDEYTGELVVEVNELPDNCQRRDALLEVGIENDELVEAVHRPEKENKRRERIRQKTEGLRKRPDAVDRD